MAYFNDDYGFRHQYDREIYDVVPYHDLNDLLVDGCSLCVVWKPEWLVRVKLDYVRGILRFPDGMSVTETIGYATETANRQSAAKDCLDHRLKSRYIFTSWKKSGVRTFRILQQGRELAVFPTLADAVRELTGGEFIPQVRFQYKISLGRAIVLRYKRRVLYTRLVRALAYRQKQLTP